MDLMLTLPSLSCITSLLLLAISLYILKKKITNPNFKSKLPPGPWTLPFIGSLHHLATAGMPHHALRKLSKLHGPVMLIRAGETDLVVISSREAAQEVMKTQDVNFADRPILLVPNIFYGCTDIAFSPHGAYWRQLRRICVTELLSPKRVKSFNDIRQQEIQSMLKEICQVSRDETPVNFSTKVARLTNNIVSRAAFGKKCKSQEKFLKISKEAIELGSGFAISDLFPSLSWLDVKMRRKLGRVHREMDKILDETLKEHLSKENMMGGDKEMEDLVDVLIKAKNQGDLEVPITFDNIKAVILDAFSAGTDTSSSTIEWVMAELIRHPKTMAKAQAEVRKAAEGSTDINENAISDLNYLKLVIKETLRLHPPLPLLLPRVCKETCKILDYIIPANSRIVINAWSLGRNPEYWEDAEQFRPERFETSSVDFKGNNFEFVPFGSGRRICPGIGFGMAVVEVVLARLLFYFDWKLPEGVRPDDLDMAETFGATIGRKEPLYLIPISRIPIPNA